MLTLVGCASVTKEEFDALKSDVQQNTDAANSAAADARAARSEAADAKAMAQQGLDCCSETQDKLDRMFKKAMYK
jgi:uncharacterized membrane protein